MLAELFFELVFLYFVAVRNEAHICKCCLTLIIRYSRYECLHWWVAIRISTLISPSIKPVFT